MKMLEKLNAMRSHGGAIQTHGLNDETLLRFAQKDERLEAAVDAAHAEFLRLAEEAPELLALPEKELITALQEGFINFYPQDAVNPYVVIAGAGGAAHLPGMVAIHHGANNSPEVGMDKGFSDGFIVDFIDAGSRDAYLADPKHAQIGARIVESAVGGADGILVYDIEIQD